MDDSATATTFSTHGLNPSKILPAPPPTIQGLYHQNTFPCPVLSERGTHHPPAPGAPYRRPAPGAARPPRSLSAAAQIRSAARRLPRQHLQPGAGDAPPRPDGLLAPTDDASPGAGDAQTAAESPSPAPLPRSASSHLSSAERPCRSTQLRGGSGSCPPCLPPAAAAAPAATPSPAGSGARGWRKGRGGEAAPGRAGVLHGRVLWPDASGLGFCVPVPKPGDVCGQPPCAAGGVFPRGRRRRPTAPSESSRREAGAVAHRDDCRACMNCGGVGVQHAVWKYSVVCLSQ